MPALSITPSDGLSRYLQEIRKFPMLAATDEFALATRWREDKDADAVHALVGSHLRLVVKIARGYRGYGLPYGDLIAEGNLGLMQAVMRFEPGRGFRLATYALWWIRASIHEYILRSWSLVKLGTTAAQKKLFFNLRKLKGRLQAYGDGDLSPELTRVIATELAVTETEVIDMNRRLLSGDQSLNAKIASDSDEEWQSRLVDETKDQETLLVEADELEKRRGLLAFGMETLSERERHILSERRLREDPVTLERLSQEYGISRERVRQIEVRAFQKLQKSVSGAAAQRYKLSA